MSYSRATIDAVTRMLEARSFENERSRNERLSKAYSLCPEIKEIDTSLSMVGREIMSAISLGKEKCAEQIEIIKNRNLELQKRRKELLVSVGLDPTYTDYRYECELCKDTGYVNGIICKCHKNALRLKSYESSGLSRLVEAQSFESFSLDYYSGREREIMEQNYEELLDFSNNFDTDKRSFLLCGGTGLGKTHLSSAVAKHLLDKGYDVIYETAQNVFSDFENDRFRDRFNGEEPVSDKYLECELLILDDLGAEMITPFSVACLYNIINTRLNKGLPIIASTNFRGEEIRKMYHDRITSRLFGEFIIKQFFGQDVRKQKILK